MTRHIIRRIRLAHCARGPERCEQCREMDHEAPCLLDIAPADAGLVTRRVLAITVDGEPAWREFDVVRVFADDDAARAYAAQNSVDDVEF